jgi:hypothetical protein
MILRAEQIFDKVFLDREDPSDFIGYISESVERELVTKVMDKLKDHELFIVKLHEPRFVEDSPGDWGIYRQDLECMEVVQCKNCRMAYPWCQKFRDELGGEGYCPYGKKVEEVGDYV